MILWPYDMLVVAILGIILWRVKRRCRRNTPIFYASVDPSDRGRYRFVIYDETGKKTIAFQPGGYKSPDKPLAILRRLKRGRIIIQ